MRRRINQWVERHQLKTYNQLLATLDTDLEHKQKFTDYLTINTSSFFRDTKVFDVIEKKVLPEISRGNAPASGARELPLAQKYTQLLC